jgi:hypothetical protein
MKSRRIRWAIHIARMEEINACNILVGKPERKRLHGRLRCRQENNIRVNLREIG